MARQRCSGTQAGNTRVSPDEGAPSESAREQALADLNAVQREALAFELRTQGYEFEEIARRCGYVTNGQPNRSAAYKAWKRALRRIPRQTIEEMRDELMAEQRAAIRALQARIAKGDTFAAKALNDFHERRAKLFGLDAPVESATGGQITLVSVASDVLAAI